MSDVGDLCDWCEHAQGSDWCLSCRLGNPCLGCEDYDTERDICLSNGGCGRLKEE